MEEEGARATKKTKTKNRKKKTEGAARAREEAKAEDKDEVEQVQARAEQLDDETTFKRKKRRTKALVASHLDEREEDEQGPASSRHEVLTTTAKRKEKDREEEEQRTSGGEAKRPAPSPGPAMDEVETVGQEDLAPPSARRAHARQLSASGLQLDRKDGDAGDLQRPVRKMVVPDPALNVPLLPVRLRLRGSDNKVAWGRLKQLPWTSTVDGMQAFAVHAYGFAPASSLDVAAELWECDDNGEPLSGQPLPWTELDLGGWMATTQPRPPGLKLLLQRHTNGVPRAFVLFTLPPSAPAPARAHLPLTTFLSASDPDIPALVAFLRHRYPAGKEQPTPIGSVGAAFPMVGRHVAVTALADHVAARLQSYEDEHHRDQKLHKIALAAAGPGTGKTRLLWESLALLEQHYRRARAQSDAALAQLLAGGVRVYATYGNGSGLLQCEKQDGTTTVVGGLAARLLHSHFCAGRVTFKKFALDLANACFGLKQHSTLFATIDLAAALTAIAYDVVHSRHGEAGSLASRYQFLMVGVDEFTLLSQEALVDLAQAIRDEMADPAVTPDGHRIFMQLMLGGTSMTMATSSLAASGMLALPMAVPPLGMKDVLAILKTPDILPRSAKKTLLLDQDFLELVADISGHPRSIDLLIQHVRALAKTARPVSAARLRSGLDEELGGYYHLVPVMNDDILLQAIRSAILGESVDAEMYQDAETRGLVLRMRRGVGPTARTYLHVPLIFLEVFGEKWRNDASFASVKHLFVNGLHLNLAHPTSWSHFEIEVLRVEALRLACTTGTKRPLADFLVGALGDPNSISGWRTVVQLGNPVVVLPHRVPFGATIDEPYDRVKGATTKTSTTSLNTPGPERVVAVRDILMGLNTDGAPFDQFSSRITDEHGHHSLLCMQSKHTDMFKGDALTLAQIQAEYGKIEGAMRDDRLRAHFGCKDAHLPFVVLLHTIKQLATDVTAAALPERCFVVGRGQFADYFGTIFGARIKMVARAMAKA